MAQECWPGGHCIATRRTALLVEHNKREKDGNLEGPLELAGYRTSEVALDVAFGRFGLAPTWAKEGCHTIGEVHPILQKKVETSETVAVQRLAERRGYATEAETREMYHAGQRLFKQLQAFRAAVLQRAEAS